MKNKPFLLFLSILSCSQSSPCTEDMAFQVILPQDKELNILLSKVDLPVDFLSETGLIYDIAGRSLEPEKVVDVIEKARQDYIKTTSPRLLTEQLINEQTPELVKAVLKDSPSALEKLEREGLLSSPCLYIPFEEKIEF